VASLPFQPPLGFQPPFVGGLLGVWIWLVKLGGAGDVALAVEFQLALPFDGVQEGVEEGRMVGPPATGAAVSPCPSHEAITASPPCTDPSMESCEALRDGTAVENDA